MRILEVRLPGGPALELHPEVTVVTNLDERRRADLVRALAETARGSAPDGAEGLLEAHGILFPLDQPTLSCLGLPADIDVVLTASELAGGGPSAGVASAPPALAAALDSATQRLEEAASALEQAVAREGSATARVAEAEAELVRRDDALAVARRVADEASAGVAAAEQRLAEAQAAARERAEAASAVANEERERRAAAVSEAETALEEARERRERAAAALADVLHAEPAPELLAAEEAQLAAEEARARAEERLEEARQRLADLRPAFAAEVLGRIRQAAHALAAALDADPEPDRDAQELAAQLERLAASAPAALPAGEARPHEEPQEPAPPDPDEVARRLEAARRLVAEAEEAAGGLDASAADIAELEAAHAEVEEAEERMERSRIPSPRAKRRLAAAQEAEDAILQRLGLPSYGAYLIRSSTMHLDPEAHRRLVLARQELAAAEAAWAAVESGVAGPAPSVPPPPSPPVDPLDDLLAQARDLVDLGPDAALDEVVDALRAIRRPPQARGQLAALEAAFAAAGVEAPGADLTDSRARLEATREWLATEAERAVRHDELAAEVTTCREALREAQAAAEESAAVLAARSHSPEVQAAVAAARQELDRAEASVAEAEGRLEDARALPVTDPGALAPDPELADAEAELDAARDGAAAAAAAGDVEQAALDAARSELDRAGAEAAEAASAVAAARSAHEAARAAWAAVQDDLEAHAKEAAEAAAAAAAAAAESAADRPVSAEEVEVYVLARLTRLRGTSCTGSSPVVVDDAVAGLGDGPTAAVLGLLARLAEAMQVVVVSDDPRVTTWAEGLGPLHGLVTAGA